MSRVTAPLGYPVHPDPYMADTLKQVRHALDSAEVQRRINGLSEERFLELLHGVLKTIHGSSVNRGYTRSVFYSCAVVFPPAASQSWSQVLGECLGLLSALDGSESPKFWNVASLVEAES